MNSKSPTPIIDCIILCGGKTEESLRHLTDAPSKGLIELGGRFMVEYVIDAVRKTGGIRRIILAANDKIIPDKIAATVDEITPEGNDMMNTLSRAVEKLENNLPGYILILPCDMPLISPEAIGDFLDKSLNPPVDITYGILSRKDSETAYPDVHHTYARIKEGTFCGTGLFMMKPGIVGSCEALFRKLTSLRKNVIALAGTLGPVLIIKFLLKQLTLEEAQRKLLSLMGNCTGRAIQTPYADAGFNVDAPNELEIAKRILTGPGS